MCDCYLHKCEACNDTLPFHIADFACPREEFKIWCHRHISQAPAGAVIFKFAKQCNFSKLPRGYKMAVAGPDVGFGKGNHPNTAVDCKETIKGE